MSLTLVLGPANSAKAGEVLSAYAAAAAVREALLVVPTSADASHYDRELAAAGVLLGRAVTFSGLFGEVATRAGFEAPRLTPLQRDRLLRLVVSALELPALGASARAPGFATAAGRLLAELARERVPPARFAAALRAWAGGDAGRAGFASDLAAVVLRYGAELERRGRLDADGFAWAALDALRAAPDRWSATPVFVYGFDDLTGIERDAIETLSRIAQAPVTVSLTFEPGRAALAARAPIVETLRELADRVHDLPSLDEHYEPSARAALHHLERHLFATPPARLDPGSAVTLLEAGGERAEAELIAAEVLAALRDGVPPGEIAVVCRSLSRAGALLERTLARFGIETVSARRVALGHSPLGRGLLALGRCALLPGERAAAADLLAYLRTPGAPGTPAEVDELEAAVGRGGLRSAAAVRAAAPFEIPELDRISRAADPAAALATAARLLLAAPRRAAAVQLPPAEELDARATAAVLEALEELSALGPAAGPELLELLEGLELPAGGGAHDGVLVAEPLAIRARRFRRVFVCGLCESEFPAPAAGDPFLGEDRRHELALASGLALPGTQDPVARERYLFYACVTRATERLVLSYRSSDEDGNLVLASPFVADVAELFVPEWRERRRRRLLADVVWPTDEAPTERERALSLVAFEHTPAGAASSPTPAETRFLGERALAHIRHSTVVSGGALESFAACPVAWLVERQLEPDELEPDPEALVRGDFMHRVLERVISELGGPITPSSLGAAERQLESLTAAPPAGLAPGAPAAVRAAILHGIQADLRRYLRHEAADGCDWAPTAVELKFGIDEEGEGLPAIELGEGEERVLLRGVIDRVDVEPGTRRALVRDYKSGANRPERAGRRWLGGAQLQVALYMIAVQRLLGLEPAAGVYQPLTGPELRARGAVEAGVDVGRCTYANDVFDAAELAGLLDQIEQEAVALAATLRRGELTPRPETCSRDGCRHPGICWAAR